MKNKEQITAFYLETLLLILVFIGIILILTQVFGLSRMQSREAAKLTDAVILAQNAAEAVSAADSPLAAAALLAPDAQDWGEYVSADKEILLRFVRSLRPDPAGIYTVVISWDEEGGGFVRNHIHVFCGTERKALYTLETAAYHREVGA